jgi:cyclophilin family peptidyl-prolyl cis-trans isomerase
MRLCRITFLLLALAVAGCRDRFTRDDPILSMKTDKLIRLEDKDIARIVVAFKTDYGEFRIQLHPEWAPLTTRHFLARIRTGDYVGQTFTDVRKNVWIVEGDPGEKPQLTGVKMDLENVTPPGPHNRGAVGLYHGDVTSLALDPDEAAGGSRFYIMLAPNPQMDGGYNVFGQVVDGMATVDRIGAVPINCTPTPQGPPCKPRPYVPLTPATILAVHLEVKK